MSDTRCLVQNPQGLRFSPEKEQQVCETLLKRWDAMRSEMGWLGPGEYKRGSYLWERYTAMRQYEYDFSHRRTMDGAFSVENLSLNMPKDFIDQHSNRAEQDLLGGDNWFGVKPEGPEDQSPALKLFERYLQRRAEIIGLRDTFKTEGIKMPLIRGDTFYKATDKITTIRETRDVRVVMTPNDSGGLDPVKDSKGEFVTELDQWAPIPENPARQMLLRDPLVTMPANDAAGQPVTPLLSQATMRVVVQSNPSRGCQLQPIYFADMGFPITDPDIRQSDTTGHLFCLAPDDLADMLPPAYRTAAFEPYMEQALSGRPGVQLLSDERTAIKLRGEEDRVVPPEDGDFAPHRYVEIWGRVDVTEAGTPASKRRREDIMMLIDYDQRIPIAYDYKYNVCPWIKDRRNPFGVIRINPLDKRATGMGYYKELEDAATFVDKQHNRVSVAIGTSGNQFFEDRSATTNRQAGKPLRFRSLDVNTLNPGRTATEALSVVTIPCEIKEISGERDYMLNRMQASKGIVTPATAGDTGFAAADTLGGMQILEKTSDVGVKQIEAHLMGGDTEGITAALRDFAEIEAYSFDPLTAEKIFSALGEAQDQAAQEQMEQAAQGQSVPPLDPAMQPADNVAVLSEWLEQNEGNIRNKVSIVLAPKNSSQVIGEAQQAIQVGTQWLTLGAQFGAEGQQALKPLFETILNTLSVPNPSSILKPTPPPPQPQALDANGQPAAPANPGPGGQPPVTPPPKPLPVAAGQPGLP